jgi:hypothetical protein
MKDALDPFTSIYNRVRWTALDDATIEGDFPLAALTIRQTKRQRRLCVSMTEISAMETLGLCSKDVALAQKKTLSGRGELTEVLTAFEFAGGPVRQFPEVSEITIQSALVLTDEGNRQDQDQYVAAGAGSLGALFIEFEALKLQGEHPEPVLKLNITIGADEFQRLYTLVRDCADEIQGITLVLEAELFGDEFGLNEHEGEAPVEFGILRNSEAPLVFAPTRLERLDVVLGKSRVLAREPVAHSPREYDRVHEGGQSSDALGAIARRLGLIIALLVVIILVMLASLETGNSVNIKRTYRQVAESKIPIGVDSRIGLMGDQDGSVGMRG